MKYNVLGLNRVVYATLFAASLMASVATFGAVAMGFEIHQRQVVQNGWVHRA
jgi:hypothetical protein